MEAFIPYFKFFVVLRYYLLLNAMLKFLFSCCLLWQIHASFKMHLLLLLVCIWSGYLVRWLDKTWTRLWTSTLWLRSTWNSHVFTRDLTWDLIGKTWDSLVTCKTVTCSHLCWIDTNDILVSVCNACSYRFTHITHIILVTVINSYLRLWLNKVLRSFKGARAVKVWILETIVTWSAKW